MLSLPKVSSASCVAALQRAGFVNHRENEKGLTLARDGRVIIVPRDHVATEAELRLILFAAELSSFEVLAHPPEHRPERRPEGDVAPSRSER